MQWPSSLGKKCQGGVTSVRWLGCLRVTSNDIYRVFEELLHCSGLGSLQLKVGVVGRWLDWIASCLTSLLLPASLDIDMAILYIYTPLKKCTGMDTGRKPKRVD